MQPTSRNSRFHGLKCVCPRKNVDLARNLAPITRHTSVQHNAFDVNRLRVNQRRQDRSDIAFDVANLNVTSRAVQPTQPPAQPTQTARTRPTSTRSNCSGGRTPIPSSKTRRRWVGFESPPSKPMKPDPPEEHEHSGEFSSFLTRFQLDFTDFVNQNNQIRHKYNRSDDSQHDLGEKSSNLKKSLPNLARSHRILAGSGEIR